MPTVITQGAASAKGYGFGARATAANYIEDVFSTYLYQGNSSTQTITNGVDLSGKGGLVWIKARNDVDDHNWYDTSRGAQYSISSNLTEEQVSRSGSLTSFNADGFSLGSNTSDNYSARTYTSWTFRKQAKFFDVVTWTGNGGTSGRTITHNLGSTPGCIIVKNTTSAEDWYVYPASLGNTGTKQYFLILNSTAAQDTGGNGIEKSSNWTSTQFSLAAGTSALNGSGQTYVAYLFAHDAGGFGASGSDNVISCGSYTGTGSSQTITLGYEPQWILLKNSTSANNWLVIDVMRGFIVDPTGNNSRYLKPNAADAEDVLNIISPTSTGFTVTNAAGFGASGNTYIYIAIRRGPMKTPTSGTSVYNTALFSGNGGTQTYSNGFPTDFILHMTRTTAGYAHLLCDRLRGKPPRLDTTSTSAESNLDLFNFDLQNSVSFASSSASINASGTDYMQMNFRRAPGFFDVVCYTGTGVNRTVSHNLGVAPELMIVKNRTSGTQRWRVYVSSLGANNYIELNTNNASQSGIGMWNNTAPTSSVFTVGTDDSTNQSGSSLVAYLFATVAGVSKVGSYTGTGTTKQIDCGFTGGARFVLIKRTDSTGDWYVWDSARGIVAGNDPYLLLNSTAAEVTNTDYVDTYSAGFEISSTAPAAINANGGSFIFLAIA